MAKYKVLKQFRDIHTKVAYEVDTEIEITEERAAEVHENLKKKGTFIELVASPKDADFDREAAKEKLTALGVEFKGNASNDTLKKLLEEHEKGE
ncbi:hypothetical protein [Halalkalibacter hemicellulosilyticus]|uniref:Uncharacterized protein n=1 Tax=Halalkalibacter hemicellulosilyticusJCM 9152 TaxID=1236971 RepID=W4QKN0_9BACI|nr:hypothetical protein [Halalkalibacter hemicellulosilyticus]GAE32442.1 hypothetical protein JCM9152_3977 [Halalkalibacter hemicellulosilyticusJCM 9152]